MLREALTREQLRAMAPDEAAAHFVARRAEGLMPHEQALLADWLAEDAAHAWAFDCADRAWGAFDEAEGDEVLAAMRAHALATPARRWVHWPRAAAAAAVVFLILASSLLLIPALDRSPAPGGGEGTPVQYASAPGQVRDVTLPDGSVVTLDADSAVRGRFGARARSLELVRGRALFEVRPDASRPFAVTAATRRVVAIGTRFEVDVAAGLKVTLLEGRVALEPLAPGAQLVTLAPGQQFVEADGVPTVRTLGVAGDAPAAWRRGLIDLDDRPLAEAVAEVNRHSRERIVIRDSKIGQMRISGQFRTGDAERFARTVAEVHPVRVVRRADEIELVPR